MELIIQHSSDSPSGYLGTLLPKALVVRTDQGEKLPEISQLSLIVSVGGEMHVNDLKKYPFLRAEAKLIEQSLLHGIPFLGICLGAELLASVLGAKVHRGGCHERGWQHLSTPTPMFSNHDDSFDLPSGATRFVTGKNCVNQGIFFQRAYGLQFHPNSLEPIIRKIAAKPLRKVASGMQSQEDILSRLRFLGDQHLWLGDLLEKIRLT